MSVSILWREPYHVKSRRRDMLVMRECTMVVHPRTAAAMYREMDMPSWLAQVESERSDP